MKKAREQYERFIGQYVHTSGNCGKLAEVDLSNGALVLDEMPVYSPGEKGVIFKSGVVVPIGSIVPTTEEDYNCLIRELGLQAGYIGKYVQLKFMQSGEMDYGKLEDIGFSHYKLSPAILQIGNTVRWTEMPIYVPRDNRRIIPALKKDLDLLVKQGKERAKLSEMKTELEFRGLENALQS